MTVVAVLYADTHGPYVAMAKADRDGLVVYDGRSVWSDGHEHRFLGNPSWDVNRGDARLYDGPHSVVAHPPCKHWGRLRHLAHVACLGCELRYSRSEHDFCPGCGAASSFVWSDADCAPRAVEQVRKWGGVLEPPSGSKLWDESNGPGLKPIWKPRPGEPEHGKAIRVSIDDLKGGYTIEVYQVEWGHVPRKRTWLYLVGVPREALEAPPFPGREPTHWISGGHKFAGRKSKGTPVPPGIKICSAQQRRRTPPLFAEYLVRLARAAGASRRAT